MSSDQPSRRGAGRRHGASRGDGDKRREILDAATRRFGADGYEHTKWADIAADVGVGPTALYHYFESKQHCLYVIMAEAVTDFHTRFVAITTAAATPLEGLFAVLADCFDLDPQGIMRNRVLVSEQGLLGVARSSSREEEARIAARARARDLEFAWASFLSRAMEISALPEQDPRLLTRAVLGLYNSVWQWYRPNGIHELAVVGEFFQRRALAMMGAGPDGLVRPRMVA